MLCIGLDVLYHEWMDCVEASNEKQTMAYQRGNKDSVRYLLCHIYVLCVPVVMLHYTELGRV
jgi:hypothetical protein